MAPADLLWSVLRCRLDDLGLRCRQHTPRARGGDACHRAIRVLVMLHARSTLLPPSVLARLSDCHLRTSPAPRASDDSFTRTAPSPRHATPRQRNIPQTLPQTLPENGGLIQKGHRRRPARARRAAAHGVQNAGTCVSAHPVARTWDQRSALSFRTSFPIAHPQPSP